MFSIFTFINSPYLAPTWSTLYGSNVWTWTLTILSSTTTTKHSPNSKNCFLKVDSTNSCLSGWDKATLEPNDIINSQQYPNPSLLSSKFSTMFFFWILGREYSLDKASTDFPNKTSFIPSRNLQRPHPPESTTPAFFKSGKKSGVFNKMSFDSFNANSNNSSILLKVFFFSLIFSEVTLITVKIVPSIGDVKAL